MDILLGHRLPKKIRKMSKRRQKIAIRRRLIKELLQYVGERYTDDLVDSVCETIKKSILKPWVLEVSCNPMV